MRSKTCRVFAYTQVAQRPRVVDAGRVDEEHGAERQQFHRLLDRVGRRAGQVGDDARPPAA